GIRDSSVTGVQTCALPISQKQIIAAKAGIEQDKIRRQTDAQIVAFTKVTTAEAEREAAEKQAEAKLQLAQAEAQSRELVARGEKIGRASCRERSEDAEAAG